MARGEPVGPLHGLPIAHKDLADTAGVRTTYGSPIYADHVPERDEPFVVRVREAGAVMLGKTNTPEFGAGSHTFNPVFGPTRNPYDLSKSAGGSSGGAAAALASGMVPIADGSDLGGSLRNPASFCGVVGFRPSVGLVPSWPDADAEDLSVDGPMARTVEDAALLLSVMADRPDLAIGGRVAGGGPRRAARRLGARLRRHDARRSRDRRGGRCGSRPIRGDGLPDRAGATRTSRARARSSSPCGRRVSRPSTGRCSPSTATG